MSKNDKHGVYESKNAKHNLDELYKMWLERMGGSRTLPEVEDELKLQQEIDAIREGYEETTSTPADDSFPPFP